MLIVWLTNSYICLIGLVARQLLRLFAPVYDTGSVKTRSNSYVFLN
jgi:hypothetical protein